MFGDQGCLRWVEISPELQHRIRISFLLRGSTGAEQKKNEGNTDGETVTVCVSHSTVNPEHKKLTV